MQSHQENPSPKSWSIFQTVIPIIQYPIKHPFKTIFYLLCLSAAAQQLRSSWGVGRSDGVIKYPIDSLHMAYTGPSFLYVPDSQFNSSRDLIGWTTDRHPTGFFAESGWHHVTTSFHLDDVPNNEKEQLAQRRDSFYKWAYLKSNSVGYGNILSHRSHMGDMQSTFGFYGTPSIESFNAPYYQRKGFIVGIRAFGSDDYYSSNALDDNVVYQLAKIDLRTIDLQKINFEYNGSAEKIVHVYVKDDKVQQHPAIEYKDEWSTMGYENYIKNLPNFSKTVDWVIRSSDLPLVLEGKPVINMLDHKEINILEWQHKQQKKSKQPLEKYSLFALPRPSDYDASYERDEISGQWKRKPDLQFKLGKK